MIQELNFKRFFASLMLLAVSTLSWAYDFVVGGIYYNITDGNTVEVTYKDGNYNSYSGTVVIPRHVGVGYNNQQNYYTVTSIGRCAFDDCSGLTSVTIPESVTSIGLSAFYGCSGLKSVTLNSNTLVSKTYTTDSNLGTIFGSQVSNYIIGNNVTSIGSSAFYGCSGLTSVTIPNSVTSIGRYAFSGCI